MVVLRNFPSIRLCINAVVLSSYLLAMELELKLIRITDNTRRQRCRTVGALCVSTHTHSRRSVIGQGIIRIIIAAPPAVGDLPRALHAP